MRDGVNYLEGYTPVNVYRNGMKLAGWSPQSKSGELVEFDDTYNDTTEVVLEGATTQAVTAQGKNLIDQTKLLNNKDISSTTGAQTATGTRTITTAYIPVLPNTSYTLSRPIVAGNQAPRYYTADKTFIAGPPYNGLKSITFTTPANCYFIKFIDEANTLTEGYQLEIGQATDYAPFVPNSPSPDYPSPVLSAGNCNLISRGKNLLNINSLANLAKYIKARYSSNLNSGAYTGMISNVTNNGFSLNDTGADYIYDFNLSGLKPSTQYTISGKIKTNDNLWVFNFLKRIINTYPTTSYRTLSYPFTSSATGTFTSMDFLSASGGVSKSIDVRELQLEEGEVATEYEPFRGYQAITIPPLNKIGDIADTYNPITGEHVQRIGVKVLDGTENWVVQFIYDFRHTYFISDSSFALQFQSSICSHFKNVNASWGLDIYGNYSDHDSLHRKYFNTGSQLPTLDDFKAWLSAQYAAGTPVTVYYQLATPITTYLTPQTIPTYPHYTQITTDGAIKAQITATVKVQG